MQAVVFDGSKLDLTYRTDYPIPKITQDDQVIVKVSYAGICGTDIHVIHGQFPAIKSRPIAMGHETSGVVHEVGKKSIFKVGQKVAIDPNTPCDLCDFCRKGTYQFCTAGGTVGLWADGGWAQYIVVPQKLVFLLPDGITLKQAGLVEPYSCVAHGFNRAAPLKVGSKILVVGAGIIGNLWISTLHLHGHRDVTVSEMSASRLEIVKRMDTGYRLLAPNDLEKEGAAYDVIIDCTGVGKVMEINCNYLRHGGKYVLFGCCPPTHTTTLSPYQIYDKELTIVGVKINPYSFPSALGWMKAMGDRYVDYHKLGVKTYRLSEYKDAISDLKKGLVAKAMFEVNQD